MPLDDIAEGLLHGFGRLLNHFFLEFVFEICVKIPGHAILRLFGVRDPDWDGWTVAITGIMFWAVVAYVLYFYARPYLL